MSRPIEDYGIIGNTYTAALVSREGSIDWLCLPRFDSESMFAALLGEPNHGRWLISPVDPLVRVSRCYRGETGILETHFETPEGNTKIVDFMALSEEGEDQVDLIRLVYGETGRVRMHTEIVLRFDYGRGIPWVRQHLGGRGGRRPQRNPVHHPCGAARHARYDNHRRVHGGGRRDGAIHHELVSLAPQGVPLSRSL